MAARDHGAKHETPRSFISVVAAASAFRPLCCCCDDVPHRLQGIDLIAGGRSKTKHRTAPKSENVYLKLLVKVRVYINVLIIIFSMAQETQASNPSTW